VRGDDFMKEWRGTMKFRIAQKEHVNAIYTIAESYRLDQETEHDRGFLVSSYTLEDYQAFQADSSKALYVAIKDDEVVGFVYGYAPMYGSPSNSLDTILKHGKSTDFIVKQICASKSSVKGTGTFLMSTLFKLVSGDIYLAIVTEPLNITSMLFHKKMGFIELKKITERDQLNRLIMVRYKNQELDSYSNVGLAQYQTSVDLYKHEDQLTWTKFNFSIITNGAILSILIPNMTGDFNKPLFVFLVVTVVLINLGYLYTIRMGRIYLQTRKKSAITMEQRLHHLGMGYIVKSNEEDKKKRDILERSLTRYVQYLIPIIFIIGWIIILLIYMFFM